MAHGRFILVSGVSRSLQSVVCPGMCCLLYKLIARVSAGTQGSLLGTVMTLWRGSEEVRPRVRLGSDASQAILAVELVLGA